MKQAPHLLGRVFEVGCTVDIENSFDSCHAHVELDGDIEIQPGDAVRVQGDPVFVPYGSALTLRRTATVTKAGGLRRLWTQLTGDLACIDLFEVSFSSGRKL